MHGFELRDLEARRGAFDVGADRREEKVHGLVELFAVARGNVGIDLVDVGEFAHRVAVEAPERRGAVKVPKIKARDGPAHAERDVAAVLRKELFRDALERRLLLVCDGGILREGFAGGFEHRPSVGRIRKGLFERFPKALCVGGVLERLDRRMHRLGLARLFEVGAVAREEFL